MRHIYLFGFCSLILALAFHINAKEIKETKVNKEKSLDKVLSDIAYIEPEVKPIPELGYDHLNDYIKANMVYPGPAILNNIEGNVYLELTVNHKGSLKKVKTIKGIGYGCDQEAERLLKEAPIKWHPGLENQKPTETKMILAVLFRH